MESREKVKGSIAYYADPGFCPQGMGCTRSLQVNTYNLVYSGARQTVSVILIPFLGSQSWLPSLVSSGWGNLSSAMGHSGAKGLERLSDQCQSQPQGQPELSLHRDCVCQGSPDKQDSRMCMSPTHTDMLQEDAFL